MSESKGKPTFITRHRAFFIGLSVVCAIAAVACAAGCVIIILFFGPLVCDPGVDCCYNDNQCMQNLGYVCVNKVCKCDYGHHSNKTDYYCGGYKWICSGDSDCRTIMGLQCTTQSDISSCRCNDITQYYDYELDRCEYKKSYSEACSETVLCDERQKVICSLNMTTNCNCPATSKRNICDCSERKYFNYTINECANLLSFKNPCKNDYQCDASVGLICYNDSRCDCLDNQYWNYYSCVDKKLNGDGCSSDYECKSSVGLTCRLSYGVNSPAKTLVTTEYLCACNDTYYYDYSYSACVPKKTYTESCSEIVICDSRQNLACNLAVINNQCNCPATSLTNYCDCIKGNYFNYDLMQCVPLVSFQGECKYDYQCNSYVSLICYNDSRCDCLDNQYWNYYSCVDKKLNGDGCSSDYECKSSVGLTCRLSYGVNSPAKTLVTTEYLCACNDTYYYDYSYSACVPKKTYTESCSEIVICDSRQNLACNLAVINNQCNCPATSLTNYCDCIKGNYFNYDLMQCVPLVSFQGECKNDYQCNSYVGLICYDSSCNCKDSQWWDGTYCLDKKDNAISCGSDQECKSVLGLTCRLSYGANLPYNSYSEAECENGCSTSYLCSCSDNYYYDYSDNACVPKKNYTDYCSENVICDSRQNLVCNFKSLNTQCNCPATSTYNMCDCRKGSYFSYDLSKCGIKSCKNDYECDASVGLICYSDSYCSCNSNQYWNGRRCANKKGYGYSCGSSGECADSLGLSCNTYLAIDYTLYRFYEYARRCPPIKSICTCGDETTFDYFINKCNDRKSYGEICTVSAECDFTRGLFCSSPETSCRCPTTFLENACDCQNGFYYENSVRSCVPVKSFMKTCTHDFECNTGVNLYCNGTYCVCDQFKWWNSSICITKKQYNMTCTSKFNHTTLATTTIVYNTTTYSNDTINYNSTNTTSTYATTNYTNPSSNLNITMSNFTTSNYTFSNFTTANYTDYNSTNTTAMPTTTTTTCPSLLPHYLPNWPFPNDVSAWPFPSDISVWPFPNLTSPSWPYPPTNPYDNGTILFGPIECDDNVGLDCNYDGYCDCGTGYWYYSHISLCVPKLELNASCTDSIQCLSGNCTSNLCSLYYLDITTVLYNTTSTPNTSNTSNDSNSTSLFG